MHQVDRYQEFFDHAVKMGCTEKAAALFADTHRFDPLDETNEQKVARLKGELAALESAEKDGGR
jgi:hypothetical protein